MKWVTRKNANVDWVASPWLINTFVDPDPEFFFFGKEVMGIAEREGATPYAVKGVELGLVDGRRIVLSARSAPFGGSSGHRSSQHPLLQNGVEVR